MNSKAATETKGPVQGSATVRPSQDVLRELRTNEVFVAIVGPAGAGSGTAANILRTFFQENEFEVEVIKASALIRSEAEKLDKPLPPTSSRKSIADVAMMQDRGDELRKGKAYGRDEDHSAIARLTLTEIAKRRASLQKEEFKGAPIEPNGTRRAYIIDSLRHPAEVSLFREVYQDAFALLGIVCEPGEREKRIRKNFFDRSKWDDAETRKQVRDFLTRDEDAPEAYGQHVSDTFHEADFFVDNSKEAGDSLSLTGMNDDLRRFVNLISQTQIIRPTIAETAMHHARSAQMRSACLSRQVGASLVDSKGNVVATGTNDVPQAGGGLYGQDFETRIESDNRCAFRETRYCSNNREQNAIINELLDEFPELVGESDTKDVLSRIRSTRIGGLIEFSRAVHAEMDAILSAAISGTAPSACRMYVTTFPCHYCARHIVASGIDEVQFVEPYPKSRAIALHDDSITTDVNGWTPPSEGGSHVLFRPFVGVAPRLYRKVFLKDRSYKENDTGDYKFGEPQWGRPVEAYKISYSKMEERLALGFGSG